MSISKQFNFLVICLVAMGHSYSQSSVKVVSNCDEQLSIYYEYYKEKNYEQSYSYWFKAYNDCPKATKNLYIHGIKIVENLIEKTQDQSKKSDLISLLMKIYDKRLKYFPENKPFVIAQKTSDGLKYKVLTKEDAFDLYKTAFIPNAEISALDHANYFSTAIDLYKTNKLSIENLFEVYDIVINSVENNININSDMAGKLLDKQKTENNLTSKEDKNLKRAKIEQKNFNSIKALVDQKIAKYATCDKLEPMIENDFSVNSTNENWLKSNGGLLARKDCDGSAIFGKIAVAIHKLNPSATSARYLGTRDYKKNKFSSALKYYKEASQLESDKFKKATDFYRIANINFKLGMFSEARNYALKAASLKGGWGDPYLLIAGIYAKSANNCGNDEFEKRAVYWVAADMAIQAKRIDPSISSRANKIINSYEKSAPSKTDIFNKGLQIGGKYEVSCWIRKTTTMR